MNASTPAHARPANRLKEATSPYLLQHAHNPVDWYPWGEEAFAKARKEDKPIFLSVGYSACHWCHVMERECFENETLARLLNEHFVAIKVDREERPDIDDLYMRYVHLTGQGGGWPMSVFMTPEAEPFFAGTYFPPARFAQLLTALHEAWRDERVKVIEAARQAAEGLRQHADVEYREPERPLSAETCDRAVQMLNEHFDWQQGGLQAPRKFPPHATLEWLLDRAERTPGDTVERRMIKLTLDRMQWGGIHDHIGGGFHRYATDREWFLPHFEKMLYDNAQLGRIYARAASVLGDPSYAGTARGIYDWVLREMTSPAGTFFSSLDADSEGVEGRFYVWSMDELRGVLGNDTSTFARLYQATSGGNYHEEATGEATGWNILFTSGPLPSQNAAQAAEWRGQLLQARAKRVRPHLDDKVLTGWNALMIGSLAQGGQRLDEPRYVAAAECAAEWLLQNLRDAKGRWMASYRAGRSSGMSTLEDYAYLAAAFLDLHAATGKEVWKDRASETARTMVAHFHDDRNGGYFLVADDHEKLLARVKNPSDNATPSGNGIAAQVFLRLAAATGSAEERARAGELFRTFHTLMDLAPLQVESLLRAFEQATHSGWGAALDAARVQRGAVSAELLPLKDPLVTGRRTAIAVRLSIDQGAYVQGPEGVSGVTHPTSLKLRSAEFGTLTDIRFPAAVEQQWPETGKLQGFVGTCELNGWLSIPADAPTGRRTLRIDVSFQACREGTCEPPETVTLERSVEIQAAR